MYSGNVTLFKSEEGLYGDNFSQDPQFGWGTVVMGDVEVIECPGDHLGMLAETHAKILAMKLMQSIEKGLHRATSLAPLPTDGVIIRAVEKGESQLFRDISLRSISESPDAFLATLDQVQDEPPAYWEELLDFIVDSPLDAMFLAFFDQQCIGFAAARIDSNNPNLSRLRWMWIASDFRGKGLGARLLETIIEWASSRGSRKMELWVSESQSAAIRLYASAGFVDTGERGILRPGASLRIRKMVFENPDRVRHGE